MIVSYIKDLLYRYECVIIPNFGGFITREISAKVDRGTHTFYPPSKQLQFNSQLKDSDGLLVNYIASARNIPYQEAMELIKENVTRWCATLQQQSLELKDIGSFEQKGEALIFEPSKNINYLTSSYGLSLCEAMPTVLKKSEISVVPLPSSRSQKGVPSFIKYAASVAVLLALGFVGYQEYQKQSQHRQIAEIKKQQAETEKTIQEATFVIKNPLPAITLSVAKETHHYHIIAGAFREPKNADKRVRQLVKKGYDARILGINKWGLTQVSYASFDDKRKAINTLNKIKRTVNTSAWLLVADL